MTPEDFIYVCRLVQDRSAVVLEAGKEYLVETRLAPVARQLRLGSVGELIARLRTVSDNGLQMRVVEAMVTTETSFFRDLHPFEALRTTVLPELIRRRKGERVLNVWSAACSTGQEPYSLAILLNEHFPELEGWRVKVLATDLSADVLGRAREGRYSQPEVDRGVPAALLGKYFRKNGPNWQVNEEIRRVVEFREMNLARAWPALPQMDVILLRNVMIYFGVETKRAILARVARVLHPDGFLILGAAETTLNVDESFSRVKSLKGSFYQIGV